MEAMEIFFCWVVSRPKKKTKTNQKKKKKKPKFLVGEMDGHIASRGFK